MKSKLFWLNVWDFIKGFIVAFLTGVLTFLQTQLSSQPIDGELFKKVSIAAVISLLAYLLKNVLTNNKDEFLTKDKK